MFVRTIFINVTLSEGIGHFRAPISKGIEIIEGLRGHTSGYAVPTFVVDAPGGGGKITLQPNYILSQSPTKTVLRNFEGVITTYPEPEHYTPGLADDYFKEIYPNAEEKRSDIGISGLLNDTEFNLVPKGLKRMDRREEFESNPEHTSLKRQPRKTRSIKRKEISSPAKKEHPTSKGR